MADNKMSIDITELYSHTLIHKEFPNYADCRPIYVEQSLKEAGFEIKNKEKVKLIGLPLEIIIGKNLTLKKS